ncbi:MAG TPA: twin-arginine translocation signal domain-containing protein [Verrucomicrobiae bacterium]|jgi:hypothetical protein|nr:twin-arginine translocation signal domain-containing protein [Verrucomicrobiae bacterium]
MSTEFPETGQSRRDFLKTSVALTGAAVCSTKLLADPPSKPAGAGKMIGMQVGAASFVDEGVDQVLDIFQEKAAVDTIFLNTFSYGRGLAGRQVPGQPFPDHGPQEADEKIFHGGNYATPHPEFYKHTVLNDTRAPDFGNLDILASVLPAAKKRGMKVFCACEDVFRSSVRGVEKVAEIDLQGRRTGTLCLLNPDVRNFWTALVTDYCKSYEVDGVLFFNERNGPLLNALGASHSQSIASSRVTCFCELHRRAAKEMGLSLDRIRDGYARLDRFIRAAIAEERPTDGYFVEFWRLLVDYPELMAWDKVFDHAKHQILSDVNSAVKRVNPSLQVGFHIEHVNSFNPIFRATRSYEDLATRADFLKIVVYNNCGGERYVHFIDNIASTVFRDVPKEELMRFNNHLLNYEEKPYGELGAAGLSADYVFRETKRAIDGVRGKCKILPGIDIGIPTGRSGRMATPEDTYAATNAGLKAGADGLIFSRKYSEMRLANVSAAGRAVREFPKN